jgi:hypothetical protein
MPNSFRHLLKATAQNCKNNSIQKTGTFSKIEFLRTGDAETSSA